VGPAVTPEPVSVTWSVHHTGTFTVTVLLPQSAAVESVRWSTVIDTEPLDVR
jgi:hypothetical protein